MTHDDFLLKDPFFTQALCNPPLYSVFRSILILVSYTLLIIDTRPLTIGPKLTINNIA